MSTQGNKTAQQMLEEFYAERRGIDQELAEINQRSAELTQSLTDLNITIGNIERQLGNAVKKKARVSPSQEPLQITEGEFTGMKRPQAVIAVLKKAGPTRSLSTQEIIQYLKEGGADLHGKFIQSTISTALRRACDSESSEVRNAGRGKWRYKQSKNESNGSGS